MEKLEKVFETVYGQNSKVIVLFDFVNKKVWVVYDIFDSVWFLSSLFVEQQTIWTIGI